MEPFGHRERAENDEEGRGEDLEVYELLRRTKTGVQSSNIRLVGQDEVSNIVSRESQIGVGVRVQFEYPTEGITPHSLPLIPAENEPYNSIQNMDGCNPTVYVDYSCKS